MFSEKEIFILEKEEPLIYYAITETEKIVDMSFFREDEWYKLVEFNSEFRDRQLYFQDMSDSVYSWYFDKKNPNYEENRTFYKISYFMDSELKKHFNVNFRDIDIMCLYESELKDIYHKQHKETEEMEKSFTKDKLREWFVDNYTTLEQCYNDYNKNIKSNK